MPVSVTATGHPAAWTADDASAFAEAPRHRISGGVAASLVLHAAIVLLIACDLLHFLSPPQEPPDLAVPVNLVRLGPVTAGSAVKRRVDLPQEPAPRATPEIDRPLPSRLAPSQRADQPPLPAPISPQPGAPPAARQALAEAVTRSQAKAPAEKVTAKDKTAVPLPAAHAPAPADPLALRLRQLAQQKFAATPAPLATGDAAGTGLSTATTTTANAAQGPQALYSARDVLRAQVIRHWNLRVEPSQSAGWTVSIHLQLRRDGSVESAEIVDPGRYRLNRPYFDFALSARNAVLMSSPLVIPPGQYEEVSDIVLPFSARDVLQ